MTLAVLWVLTGSVIVVCGVCAGRSHRALMVGLGATVFAMAGLGAVGTAVLVATGTDVVAVAATSWSATVRDAAGAPDSPLISLVLALSIAVQATAGLVILFGGRWVRIGLGCAVAVQVALLAFGWWSFLTSPVLISGLLLLARAHRREEIRPLYVPDILRARQHDHH